jgi:hypothetical protein
MTQIVSDRIDVAFSPERLQLPPDSQAEVTLRVTNRASVVDQLVLRVEGIDPSWLRVVIPDASLMPGATGTLRLRIQVPAADAAPAGVHQVHLAVASRSDPQAVTAVDLPLEILPVGGFEIVIAPELLRTRRTGVFRVRVTNRSTAERVVTLAATDPDEALQLSLARRDLDLPSGASEEVRLSARPVHRPLFAAGEQIYRFTVVAQPELADGVEVAELLAGVEATLIFRSVFAFLARIRGRLGLLVLALMGLVLLAALILRLLLGGGPQNPPAKPSPAPELTVAPTSEASTTPGRSVELTPEPTGKPTPAAEPTPGTEVQAKPAPPTISRFEVVESEDVGRGVFVLSWAVQGADEVMIAGEQKADSGTETIQDLQDAEFELDAINAGGTVKKTIGIVVLRPPEIQELSASATLVDSGEPVTLTWRVKHAERASLADQQVDPGEGIAEVRPNQSAIYTLVVENELGRMAQSVEVDVRGSPPPHAFEEAASPPADEP